MRKKAEKLSTPGVKPGKKAVHTRVVLRPEVDVDDDRLLLPTGLVAKAFDISLDAVVKWNIKPVVKEGAAALLYLPEVIANRLGFGPDGAPKLNPAQEKALLDKVRRESAELDLKKKRGALVSLDDIGAVWEKQFIILRQRIIGLPNKAARPLAMMTNPQEIQSYLQDELFKILEEFNDYDPSDAKNGNGASGGSETDTDSAEGADPAAEDESS